MGIVDVDGLLAEVAADVGLDDYGASSFRDGLEVLWEAGRREAELTEVGVLVLEGHIRASLANRLRVVEWHRTHPDLAATSVDAPLVLVGLPRTGTTVLSHLLAADPANRSLLGWEVNESLPPPAAATYATDPRYLRACQEPHPVYALNPAVKAIHYDAPGDPVECIWLYAQHFQSVLFPVIFNIPSYDEWLLAADWSDATRYHRSVLQVLQSECPGRWQLKSTHYSLQLETLLACYPDARLVVTHRDPVTVVASTFSLLRSASSTFTETDFTGYLASQVPTLIAAMADRSMDARDRIGDERFFDVFYDDIVRDPVAVVRSIYAHYAMEYDDETDRRLRQVHAENPQHRFGRHEYSLADMGIDRDALEARFARYSDRYGLARRSCPPTTGALFGRAKP